MQVGENAVKAIIGFEVSSPEHYAAFLSRPYWPGGMSGVTIGIGYDLGQHKAADVRADWGQHFGKQYIDAFSQVATICGDGAKIRVSALISFPVRYSAAAEVFEGATLPKFATETLKQMPNCSQLHPDAFGALVSISYNRGAGAWSLTDGRRREMHQIQDAMSAKDFASVPGLIRAMKRLWQDASGKTIPGSEGLVARREAEAVLFETAQGLTPAKPEQST